MDIDDKKRLQANHQKIVEDVRVKDIKDYLHSKGVLTLEDKEEVSLSTFTQSDRMRKLLSIIPRRGPKAFGHFIDSLREEYEYLIKEILETDISEIVLVDEDIDYKEKLNTLQAQIWQQTQAILQFQSEIVSLKNTVDEQKKEKEFMDKTGLRPEMVSFMHYDSKSLEEPDYGPMGGDSIKVPSSVLRSHTDPVVIKETAIELGFDVMNYLSDPKSARPAKSQYVINMRRVVSDLFSQHSQDFEGIILSLKVNEMNGYETLLRIADEIFRGQINWGRIGVWFTFGATVGIHCQAHNMPEISKWIAEFTGIYVGQNLLTWIQKNDGWNGLNKFVADKEQNREKSGTGSLGLTLSALGLVGLGIGAYAAYKSTS